MSKLNPLPSLPNRSLLIDSPLAVSQRPSGGGRAVPRSSPLVKRRHNKA